MLACALLAQSGCSSAPSETLPTGRPDGATERLSVGAGRNGLGAAFRNTTESETMMPGQSDKNFFDLTVRSTSGTFQDRYNRNNRAEKVFDDAVKYFGLNTSGATYVLRREADNRSLSLAEKLEDLGLVDGDVLLLQTNQAQDG